MSRPSPELVDSLRRFGLVDAHGALPPMTALTGGVSSEIWRIDLPDGAVVAKRALARLRVAGDWTAPVERTQYEVAWMRRAQSICPGITPIVLAADDRAFVMSDLSGLAVWKEQLLAGQADPATAVALGRALAAIHGATAGDDEVRVEFDNADVFAALRLDPYLAATARVHPDRAAELTMIRDQYLVNRRVLVHGDISPKNVLVGPSGPVVLDAECATWGDPAFDLAFCTTHLLLKCRAVPTATAEFLGCAAALAGSYTSGVTWEDPNAVEARCAWLVGALLLARVDGLSPVEYLGEPARASVRESARALLRHPPSSLADLRSRWGTQ